LRYKNSRAAHAANMARANDDGGEMEMETDCDGDELWFDIIPDMDAVVTAEADVPAVTGGRDLPVSTVLGLQEEEAISVVQKDNLGFAYEVKDPQGLTFQVQYPQQSIRTCKETCASLPQASSDIESAASTCPGSPSHLRRFAKMSTEDATAAMKVADAKQASAGAAYAAAAHEAARALAIFSSLRRHRRGDNDSETAFAVAMAEAKAREIAAEAANVAARAASQQADLAAARAWMAGARPDLKPALGVIVAVLNGGPLELEFCKRHHRWRRNILGAEQGQHAEQPSAADPAQVPKTDKIDVIFCGRGGVGRRAAWGCFGRRSKQSVVKYPRCKLVARHGPLATTLEFEMEGTPTIRMAMETLVGVKGTNGKDARVEIALADGRYIWMWKVPARTVKALLGLCAGGATSLALLASSQEQIRGEKESAELCGKHQAIMRSQLGFDTSSTVSTSGCDAFLSVADKTTSTTADGRPARVPKLRLEVVCLELALAQPDIHSLA